MGKLVRSVLRLHRDRRGDLPQNILLIALIAIPLLLLLITFSSSLQNLLNTQFGAAAQKTSNGLTINNVAAGS